MSKDKSSMTLFKTTWDSFIFRVNSELVHAIDNDIDTNKLKYVDFMNHLKRYREMLVETNNKFEKPHNFFFKSYMKKFDKLEVKINGVYNPLIKEPDEEE